MATCIVKTGNSAGVNVRASKDTSSAKLGVIDNGVSVDVVRCDSTWATLMYNSTPAFVQHRYLQNPPSTNGDGLSVNANTTCNGNSVNVRNAANGNTVVKLINKGASYKVLDKLLKDKYYWYKIGTDQWVRGDYLTPNSSGSSSGGNTDTGGGDYPIQTTIDTVKHGVGGTVKLRAKASKNSDTVTNIPNNSTIYVKMLSGSWLAAKYNSYTGYIMAEFVVGSDAYNGSTGGDTSGGTGINTASWSEVLAGNGTYRKESSGSAVCEGVKTLQRYLIAIGWGRAAVLGTSSDLTVDGNFGSKTETAVKNFQYECELSQDGIVGVQTATKLNSYHNDPNFTAKKYHPLSDSEWSYNGLPSWVDEISLCAHLICAEHSRNDSTNAAGHEDARAGIAKVLRNRKNSPLHFNEVNGKAEYKSIIFASGQFNPATGSFSSRKMARFARRGTSNSIPWQQAIKYASQLVNNQAITQAPKVTNQLYFNGYTPSWTPSGKKDLVYYPDVSTNKFTAFFNK